MYCTNCGEQVNDNAVVCLKCGANPRTNRQFCRNCGQQISNPAAIICTSCGVSVSPQQNSAPVLGGGEQKDWLTTLLLCIFLGGLGVHRFYTGHTAIGLVQLFTGGGCGIWTLIDLITIITGSYKDAQGNPLYKKN